MNLRSESFLVTADDRVGVQTNLFFLEIIKVIAVVIYDNFLMKLYNTSHIHELNSNGEDDKNIVKMTRKKIEGRFLKC